MGCGLPQERKANIATIQPAEAKTATIYRRIGSTTYKVKVVFSDNGGETMEEKILRMIRNEGLQNGEERGTMDAPQMSRQSERSAS